MRMKLKYNENIDFENIGSSLYGGELGKCRFNMHYGNGKTKINGKRVSVEESDLIGITKLCKIHDIKSNMFDSEFGLVCVNCYSQIRKLPKKEQKKIL